MFLSFSPRCSALALLLALAAASLPGCRRGAEGGPESTGSAEAAVLRRQQQGIAGLLARAQSGSLVKFDQVLVVVDQKLVQELVAATLPVERVVGDRYRIELRAADVRFEDGFALLKLEGRATLASRTDAEAVADVTVYGALDVVELDPASGVLRGRVTVIAVDARRVAVMGVGTTSVEALIEDLGRERLETFAPLLSTLEIPVSLERSLDLPAVAGEGGVRIDAARLPLRVAVSDVQAFRGKLWISVSAGTGPDTPLPTTGGAR